MGSLLGPSESIHIPDVWGPSLPHTRFVPMSFVLGVQPRVKPTLSGFIIKEVRAFVPASKGVEEAGGGGADCHAQKHGHWIVDTPIANPSSCFQDAKTSRKTWGIDAIGTVVVEVELHSGVIGVGVSIGGPPACYMIEEHFSRFVEGQDVRNVELIWDQMWRGCVNYGRKGLPLQAMSAVDLAIWDALGIAKGEPVYNLLGGKTKEKLPMYATSTRPDLSKKLGFKGGKIPLPYGPADGDEGMRMNIEHIKRVRESVGVDFPLMVDCYMALTVPYTVELARRIDREVPGGVKWIEEFLPPDQYDGYAEVRQKVTTTLLTTGEHEYTRWGYRLLLEKKAVDVLQPDITWVGGLTEARRIVALAASYDIPVIPHGSSVYSYHMQFAFHNCPVGELIVLAPEADVVWPLFGGLFKDEPMPENGYITLTEKPGFGVTLNREGFPLERPYKRTPKTFEQIEKEKDARTPDQAEWLTRAATKIPIGQPPSSESAKALSALTGGQ